MNEDTPHEADLARLADGSLTEAQAARVRARLQEVPELRERLREQERAVGLTRSTAEIAAPASLLASVHGLTARRGTRRRSSAPRMARPRLVPFAAGALLAVVIAVVALAGHSRPLTVDRAARVAFAVPIRPAPRVAADDPDLLSLRVGSIAFPAYESRSDWRAVGARTDELGGRRVQTVFYDIAGRRVGYSIVTGASLGGASGQRRTINGVVYTTRATASGQLVTWRREGHTCIIAARRLPARTLLRLADATHVAT